MVPLFHINFLNTYMLPQELCCEVIYEVFNHPNNSSDGIVMWNGKYCALLSSKDNDNPYDFIEMVMRDMEEGDIVILFSKADYEAATRCDYHIKAKKLKIKLEN